MSQNLKAFTYFLFDKNGNRVSGKVGWVVKECKGAKMADFNKPTVDSEYTQFPTEIRAAISAALSFWMGSTLMSR